MSSSSRYRSTTLNRQGNDKGHLSVGDLHRAPNRNGSPKKPSLTSRLWMWPGKVVTGSLRPAILAGRAGIRTIWSDIPTATCHFIRPTKAHKTKSNDIMSAFDLLHPVPRSVRKSPRTVWRNTFCSARHRSRACGIFSTTKRGCLYLQILRFAPVSLQRKIRFRHGVAELFRAL